MHGSALEAWHGASLDEGILQFRGSRASSLRASHMPCQPFHSPQMNSVQQPGEHLAVIQCMSLFWAISLKPNALTRAHTANTRCGRAQYA